jgi:hypothetical protein
MDDQQFDRLSKDLAAGLSRRSVLKDRPCSARYRNDSSLVSSMIFRTPRECLTISQFRNFVCRHALVSVPQRPRASKQPNCWPTRSQNDTWPSPCLNRPWCYLEQVHCLYCREAAGQRAAN